ncbi:MAG TPA: phosphate ABC transporter permease PstA [Acidimicrobiales bacterium]|nr:phosphate ABC transporter permease PstA [Acidimicrobiales bacterium]
MTGTLTPPRPDTEVEHLLTVTISRGRRIRNRLAGVWMYASFVLVAVPLVIVIGYVVIKGIGVIDGAWFTQKIFVLDTKAGGGMAPAIVGTIVITFWATLLAVPLGVLAAIYLHEYGKRGRLARVIRFMSEVMTGVPSIIMGLFVFIVFTVPLGAKGLVGFGGSLALACLMLPIVIRSSEEMLRLVPDDLRQASYALGNRKWRTIVTVVLPAALGGMVSGIMLAVARAAGETAPLLFTIGASRRVNWNVFQGPNTALPLQIWNNSQSPYLPAQNRAWGAALTLVVLVFVLTLLARFVSSRFSLKHD